MGWRPSILASECQAALKPSAMPFELRSALTPRMPWCVSTLQTPSILCCVAVAKTAVANRRPEMLSSIPWLYGAHSNLLVEGAPADAAPVSSQRGVRQDYPLGPFLFGMTLQGALEQEDAAPLKVRSLLCTMT
jgi:hypothetical protein